MKNFNIILILFLMLLSKAVVAQQLPYLIDDQNTTITMGVNTNSSSPSGMFQLNDLMFYSAYNAATGYEPWVRNLTTNTASLIKDLNPGTFSTNPYFFTRVNNSQVLFSSYKSGFLIFGEVYITDGTAAGTYFIANGYSNQQLNVGDYTYFTTVANDRPYTYVTDGTVAGTTLIRTNPFIETNKFVLFNGACYAILGRDFVKFNTPTTFSVIKSFDNRDGKIAVTGNKIFIAVDNKIFTSDGTIAGTNAGIPGKTPVGGGFGMFKPYGFYGYNGSVYYSNGYDPNGNNLYKSDGISETLLKTYSASFPYIENFIGVNNTVYFTVSSLSIGTELWKTDGTETGTLVVKELVDGAGSADPSSFIEKDNLLYFTANSTAYGREVFKTDGTEAGTVPLEVNKGVATSFASSLALCNNKLYFSGNLTHNGKNYGNELMSFGACGPNGLASSIPNATIYNEGTQFGSCSCDEFNKVISYVAASGSNPIVGSVNSKLWIEPTQPVGYVKRHYEITPVNNPSTASGRITLYFTDQEFIDFNNQSPTPQFLMPIAALETSNQADFNINYARKGNLRMFKYSGQSADGTGSPQSYGITPTTLTLDGEFINWEPTLKRWMIDFSVEGFSGFFLGTTANNPLPLNLLSLSGKSIENNIQLNWKAASETNFSHFEIQKSSDSKEFGMIGKVMSSNSNYYNFTDTKPVIGNNYFRLKMVDLDGSSSFSKTIMVNYEKDSNYLTVENPVKNGEFSLQTNFKNPEFTMVNSLGKKLEINYIKTGENNYKIKANNLATGIYYLLVQTEGKMVTRKVLME